MTWSRKASTSAGSDGPFSGAMEVLFGMAV
jgi:hypothetical protein